jgi:transcriptional regulator with PAS, ATPase and Fis domain
MRPPARILATTILILISLPPDASWSRLRELEDDYIQEILVATGNNKTQAARILGIHPTSLLRRLKKDSAAE